MNNISIWKRLLFIFATLILLFVVGYFIFTGKNLPERKLPAEGGVTVEQQTTYDVDRRL